MRVLVCKEFGPPEKLEWTDLDDPSPAARQVCVDITAAGVGFVDGLMIQGLYQVKPRIGKITWLFPDCLDYRRWGQGVSTSETFKRRNEMGVISHGGRGYCGTDQQGRIVELKFFGGMTNEEIAEVEKISLSTVKRQWRAARAWMLDYFGGNVAELK